ncbi:MAG TPA: DsbA family protein [Sphingomicrobium sp.]
MTAALLLLAMPQWLGNRIVREAMLNDPQILVDTADALRDRQHAPAINANRAAIQTPFGSSWKGAENPDVILVEYYDYACPYCKASNPHLERLIKEDKGLRVVFKELPILGPDSAAAARVSLAAARAGKFAEFHDTLWAAGRPSPETIQAAAKAAGISSDQVKGEDIEAELRRNFQVAGQLGATGTPLFVIGDRVINSAVGYEQLKKAIADARKRS